MVVVFRSSKGEKRPLLAVRNLESGVANTRNIIPTEASNLRGTNTTIAMSANGKNTVKTDNLLHKAITLILALL